MNIPTILVPLDGSKIAECVLPYAIELADKLCRAIELVCVSPMIRIECGWPTASGVTEVTNGDDSVPSNYLRATAKRIEAVSSAQVLCTVLLGPPTRELVKHSYNHRPDLMIISTHGRGPVNQAWLGSVADRVVRHASMPVLLVRHKDTVDSDLSKRCHFGHILVALDGSPQAEASLDWAREFGGVDTAYTLIRVEPKTAPLRIADPECTPFSNHGFSRTRNTEAAAYLSSVESRVINGSRNVSSVVLEGVPVALGILKAAEQNAADLITVTTHTRNGLPRLIMGSVGERFLLASKVPVLVVRPEQPVCTSFSVSREISSMALRN